VAVARNAVVVGLARSGVAAAEFLARRGASVVATDRKPEGELQAEAMRLTPMGVRLELGGHRRDTFVSASLVVVSPGVPWDMPELEAARAAGVPVLAEIELAFRNLKGRVAAITGTKGKSTTTAALGAMLRERGGDVRVGGNIGEALISLVEGSTEATDFVVEVSSFQLEGIEAFRPHVAVFLNLSPDHLDRHPSFEAYADAKARVFENQTEADWAVVSPLVKAHGIRARVVRFHEEGEPPAADAAFFRAGHAVLRLAGREEPLFPRSAVHLPGPHLAGDLLAAAAAARLLGADSTQISRTVEQFRGVPHVLEHVLTSQGVAYYNDSKATNVEAARKSLESFAGPLLVVMGGRYKGGDFRDLRPALAQRGKRVMAIGETRAQIATALRDTLPVDECSSLREALERAAGAAVRGDTVLLAPACSSFDMFRDYAERGQAFKDEVRRLVETGPPARSAAPISREPGSSPGERDDDHDGGARTRKDG
jgi:UDP-N-acetylmuramoylalanine--D-glutamate ligase